MDKIQFVKTIPLVLATLVLLAACSPKVDTGGYVKTGDIKDQIAVGKSSKDDVLAKLGSPSSQSSFGDETWYYITDRKETTAFLKPKIVEQEVARVTFDKAGIVSKVEGFTKDDAKKIAIAKRTTPTEGHTLGFVEQVLGNVGRFNKPAEPGSTVPGGRRPRSANGY
jgi:outer membrane protein assembly factor BamE (lipoprotein component of BamABCDE complex)